MSDPRPSATSGSSTSTLRDDLLASVVVFLVALPLCMGVAIASGAPVAAGLITGIIGGIVTGALAGCPLQVSGPAAGLTVIVFEIVDRLGLPQLGLVVLVSGLLQMLAGIFRLGQWFRAVSPAVIKGMLAGIGFLILASQFHVMLDAKPPGSGAVNLDRIPTAISRALTPLSITNGAPFAHQRDELQQSREIVAQQASLRQRVAEASENPATPDAIWTELAEAQLAMVTRLSDLPSAHSGASETEAMMAKQQAIVDLQAVAAAMRARDRDAISKSLQSAADQLGQWHQGLKHPSLAGALG
ncbi:MAG: SulP family inorganic anion transporter, partial [Planctomycetaceae bacterium]|nr:SulP family inorganic anion transporter [Planctomycetaceae bacterium]